MLLVSFISLMERHWRRSVHLLYFMAAFPGDVSLIEKLQAYRLAIVASDAAQRNEDERSVANIDAIKH